MGKLPFCRKQFEQARRRKAIRHSVQIELWLKILVSRGPLNGHWSVTASDRIISTFIIANSTDVRTADGSSTIWDPNAPPRGHSRWLGWPHSRFSHRTTTPVRPPKGWRTAPSCGEPAGSELYWI